MQNGGMLIGAFSLNPRRGDVAGNLAAAEAGLREASAAGCRLVVLPEMWTTSFADFSEPAKTAALFAESERALERVSELSKELDLVIAGTAPAMNGAALPFNRLTIFARGERVLEYDKVHLFTPTAEELSFAAGTKAPLCIDSERTGLPPMSGATCYDLRFGETFKPAIRSGAKLLVIPAQWPTPRQSHWGALLSGCAVENQCFVVGCNRTGTELVGRRKMELVFPGNSMVVDPSGKVLVEGQGDTGLIVADVDFDEVDRIRTRVPVKKDRRDDLYADW